MEPGGQGRIERRLAAILAADVAWYSRLMGADEEGMLERVKALRRRQHDPATLGGKRPGGGQSDAAARTGNQSDLAVQFEVHDAASPRASI